MTLVGAALDFGLGVSKIIVGIVGHSQGLVADGVHSLSDLVTDALVIWAAKVGTSEADKNHPYGHERIQTVSTVLLGAALIAVALGIGRHAIEGVMFESHAVSPTWFTLVIAFISIVSKEWIYRYTLRVARRIKSKLLEANAWHSRSDAFSSVVVLIGIVGAQAGFSYLDAIAALVVAAMIVWVGWKMVLEGVRELIDTGIDNAEIDNLQAAMSSVEGVRDVHQLRTRKMGSTVVADVHVIVNPDISVSEGHRIADEVEKSAVGIVPDDMDITVHIDPTDDRNVDSSDLPMRQEIEQLIRKRWAEVGGREINRLGIHYNRQQVDVDLIIVPSDDIDLTDIEYRLGRLRTSLRDEDNIGNVKVLLEVTAPAAN